MSKHFYILSDVNINVTKMSLEEIWIRIHLPMQGTRVQCLVWEDPTGRGETRPVHHDCWASAPEPTSCNYWARVPQLLKPGHLGPAVCNRRSQRGEKPVQHNEEQPPLATTRERPRKATEDSAQPGINDFLKKSWRHPSLCPSLLYILTYNIHLVLYYISHNMYFTGYISYIFVVQSHSCVWLFATPWTAACQDPLSFTISRCHPAISSSAVPFSSRLQPFPASGCFPKNRFFTSGGKNIGASASVISPPNECSGLISFRTDWFDLPAVQGTLKSLLQHHSWKVSMLCFPAFLYTHTNTYTCIIYIYTHIWPFMCIYMSFPGGSDGKKICLHCGKARLYPWVRKIPWRREWLPISVFLPGESHGQKSLAGYCP